MKFDYEKGKEVTQKCVAELFHMSYEPEEVCLNLNLGDGKVCTIYYDGEIVIQPAFDCRDVSIKKFYPGDTITITF